MDATTKAAMASRRRSVSRVSVVDQVCSSIKQDIADGIWKEGEKLPSEGEFAELIHGYLAVLFASYPAQDGADAEEQLFH